jgi:hypothetical protein
VHICSALNKSDQDVQILIPAFILGICKHAVAFGAWCYQRSEEPSPTDTKCYWTKAPLSFVDSRKPVTEMFASVRKFKSEYQCDGSFLEDIKSFLMKDSVESMLKAQLKPSGHPFSLHHIAFTFALARLPSKEASDFKTYIAGIMERAPAETYRKLALKTEEQSGTPLWAQLRFGRITASVLSQAAACSTEEGRQNLASTILGGGGKFNPSEMMLRGLNIEDGVRAEFSKVTGLRVKKGSLVLDKCHPAFGASPDGVGKDFVLEIKSPLNKNEGHYLLKDGKTPSKKVLLQILLQIELCKKKKGFLVIVDEKFEQNRKIKVVEVAKSPENDILLKDSMAKAEEFWDKYVYLKLMKTMRLVLI